jgi:hypothetical protein
VCSSYILCAVVKFLKLLSDDLLLNTDTKMVLQIQKIHIKMEEFVKRKCNALNRVNVMFAILST